MMSPNYPAWFLKLHESDSPDQHAIHWDQYMDWITHINGCLRQSDFGTVKVQKAIDVELAKGPVLDTKPSEDFPDEGILYSQTKPTNPKDRLATNRLDLSLFPATARAYGAIGMTEGDCKYGGYNYRKYGVSVSVYYAAANRHLDDYYNGEWSDRKTKVPHLASALACIAILIDSHEQGNLVDDRPPKVDFRKLLIEAEAQVKHLHEIFPDGPQRFTQLELEERK